MNFIFLGPNLLLEDSLLHSYLIIKFCEAHKAFD